MDPSIEADIQHVLHRRAENGGPLWSRADGNPLATPRWREIESLTLR